VRILRELRGTIKARKGGNKMQAVVLHLVKRLQKPPLSFTYHIFLDNLFISTKFVEYAHTQGIAITSTCRDTRGVI